MVKTTNILCETPRCVELRTKYGDSYHRVYSGSQANTYHARCEGCGATYRGGSWQSTCSMCHKSVEPGELVGLFVPHLCRDCEESVAEVQRKAGNVCRMCNQPYSRCCC